MWESASGINGLTTCSICHETFNNPRSLPCLHTFCLDCIQDLCKGKRQRDQIPCPVSRTKFRVPSSGVIGLPHNFIIQDLVDAKKITSISLSERCAVPCEVCQEEKGSAAADIPPATKYCVDCEQKLCDRCSAPHRRWRGGGHDVKEFGPELELSKLRARLYCNKHKDKLFELFCVNCLKTTCALCASVEHEGHKLVDMTKKDVESMSQTNSDKEQIADYIKQIEGKITEIRDGKSRWIDDVDAVRTSIEEAGEKAKATAERVKLMIDRQVRQQLGELQTKQDEQVKTAETAEDDLQLELVTAESFHRHVTQLVEKGRPRDVTAAAEELHARARQLLRNDVTSVHYKAPRVTLAPSGVTKIINADFVGQLTEFQVGNVVDVLPVGEPVAGVAMLCDNIYVLRARDTDAVEVYDGTNYNLLGCLMVPDGGGNLLDMTSCDRFLCLYISEPGASSVHRLDLQGDSTTWHCNNQPFGLSVNAAHHVLATFHEPSKIGLFPSHGKLLREIELPITVVKPWHAMQLESGKFIVCHGIENAAISRVCMMSEDGRNIVQSHDLESGSDDHQYDGPFYLAADGNGFVFVADANNRRVKVLTPELNHVCDVVTGDQLKWQPPMLCFDARIGDFCVSPTTTSRTEVVTLDVS